MSCHFYKNKYELSNLEVTEKEINNRYQRQNFHPNYPRHIANVSAKSHRNSRQMNHQKRFLPTTCQLEKSQPAVAKEINIALEVLRYQLNDKQAKQIHLENVRNNLEKRLQAAKASGDHNLVALLQKESQQLEINV